MATLSVSDYYSEAGNWDRPNPNYNTLLGQVGGGSGNSQAQVASALLNIASHSPVVIAFIMHDDEDKIFVGHTVTKYPTDLENNTPFDDLVTILVGNDLATAVDIVLPAESFQRTADVRALTTDEMTGANGHGTAGGAVVRFGPHGTGVANTTQLRARRAMLLPPSASGDILSGAPDGSYSLIGFWNTLVQPGVTDADADIQALWEPVRDWYRVACTNDNTGHSVLNIESIVTANPLHRARLNAWSGRQRNAMLTRAGRGGATLTAAAFQAGIANLTNTLDNNAAAAIAYHRDRNDKSFTDRHGQALAQRVHRLCGVADDAHLPEIHVLLAKAPKGKEFSIIQSALATRAESSSVQLNARSAPLATTTLVDEVFRSFNPAATHFKPGSGLSPFAIICEGHAESHKINKAIRKAEIASEAGGLTLRDAETLVSTDVHMPTSAYAVIEKICGWSVTVDVFHGSAHPISTAIRNAARALTPSIHRCYQAMGDDPKKAMEFLIRCMYEMQQDYVSYVNGLVANTGPAVPSFASVINAIESCRDGSISTLPFHYQALLHEEPSNSRSSGNRGGNAGRESTSTGTGSMVNSHVDSGLRTRFANHGSPSISAMTQGHDVTFPKQSGKEVCLTWALKGQCSRSCRRKEAHIRYNAETIRAIHTLMDECGVATVQP